MMNKKLLPSIFLFFILITFTFSCRKKDTLENSLSNSPSYHLFNFDYNNSYIVQSNQDTVTTENGFYQNLFAPSMFQPAEPSASIWLSDGEINDTLRTCCGSYNYNINPTTLVRIWFPNPLLTDGIYEYNFDSVANDFYINVHNEMEFSNCWGATDTTCLISDTILANSNGTTPSYNKVNDAIIKIENLNSNNASVKFIIHTIGGEEIKGSYLGSLKDFLFVDCYADCD